ncbi:MAG: hypothetical protein KBD78_09320 [Oligoflexales bacterium]|nr:hypothetical protein [Oligoflexales bacterium]
MFNGKKIALRQILESSEGIHLTAYLVNRGDLVDLKVQLNEIINETHEWLQSVQSLEEKHKFFKPLYALLNDSRIFKSMTGNIGIFRNKNSFRILNIAVDIEKQCHVASSFHVKPLLRSMQFDHDFLPEFRNAERQGLSVKNIFQISKAVVKGRVRKLIIADDWLIHGKVDKHTGSLTIHPFDVNHEDDDILDDLAQTVLAFGGEVVLVPRAEIPKSRPALAILQKRRKDSRKKELLKDNEHFRERISA